MQAYIYGEKRDLDTRKNLSAFLDL